MILNSMRLMDNFALNVSSQKLVLGFTTNPRTDATISNKPLFCSLKTTKRSCALYKSKSLILTPRAVNKSNDAKDWSARSSSSSNQETSSEVACRGSTLLWVGVGIALSPVFSSAASYLKKYAMTMIGKMDKQNNKSASAGISQGSAVTPASVTIVAPAGFGIEVTQVKQSATAKKCSVTIAMPAGFEIEEENNQSATSQGSSATSEVTVDVPPSKTEATPAPTESKDDIEILSVSKKSGMSQSPQNFEQVQEMLNDIEGSPEWDNRFKDLLKDFDPNNPEFKESFVQAGTTVEEVVSKVLVNPDAVMAFQNPRVQAAILDLSEDPSNIKKYQDDKEVMDGINKILGLFPGATDAP